VRTVPSRTGFGLAVMVRSISAIAITLVFTDPLLFAKLGSVTLDVRVDVLVIVAVVSDRLERQSAEILTTIAKIALAPLTSVPTLQVSVVVGGGRILKD
jgi:hypothetical protein